jgi:type III pantothenate kinase
MMANSLRQQTSDIPSAGSALLVPGTGMEMFASSTNRAIACGAFGAVCGAIERATDAMRAAGYRPRIILTGGDAARILKVLRGDCLLRPHLVLQGLAHMLDGDS